MEVQEEVIMGSNDQMHMFIKGKRTKRQRLSSPLALAMICSSSSGEEGEGEGEGEGGGRVSDYSGGLDRATATTSPTTSTDQEFAESTEEEEDMANCLILLAQGRTQKAAEPATAATTAKASAAAAGGFYVYQCKTCDRCFPSFQALGGHRASHKRPKAPVAEEKRTWALMEEEDNQFIHSNTALSLQIPNRSLYSGKKSKVHECSICGAEFSSGQALGGHMRRHRTFTGVAPAMAMAMAAGSPESQESKKPRNILQLDLNLPAPEDDHRDSKFPFVGKEQALVFSASPLVDCHY